MVPADKDSLPNVATLKGPISAAVHAKMRMVDLVENSEHMITHGEQWPDSLNAALVIIQDEEYWPNHDLQLQPFSAIRCKPQWD